MSEIIRSNDCGNSPKNKFAEDIALAIELRNVAFLSEALAADASWELPDGSLMKGADMLGHVFPAGEVPDVLTIDHAITHGKVGAVNGTAEVRGSVRRFCHVIDFSSTKCEKVRRLVSYVSS
jgi:hypothetical protein